MKAFPENKTVLCERTVEPKSRTDVNGIFCEKEALPVYRIVSTARDVCSWKPGDMIVCDSTGTRLNIPGGGILYLFKEKNIACRISDACTQKGNQNHGE